MVLCSINKNYPQLSPNTPSYLELCIFPTHELVQHDDSKCQSGHKNSMLSDSATYVTLYF